MFNTYGNELKALRSLSSQWIIAKGATMLYSKPKLITKNGALMLMDSDKLIYKTRREPYIDNVRNWILAQLTVSQVNDILEEREDDYESFEHYRMSEDRLDFIKLI